MTDRDIFEALVRMTGLSNKKVHPIAQAIWKMCTNYGKQIEKITLRDERERIEKQKVSREISPELQELMDHPLSQEEEYRHLRAMLHSGLLKGEINPQLLEKLDKIIGVSGGEDEKLAVVDFSEAFPDLAEAIAICRKPIPVETESKQ